MLSISKQKVINKSKNVYRWPVGKLLVDSVMNNHSDYIEFENMENIKNQETFSMDFYNLDGQEVFCASLDDDYTSVREVVSVDGYGRGCYTSISRVDGDIGTLYFVRSANVSENGKGKFEIYNYRCGYYVYDIDDMIFPEVSTDYWRDLANIFEIPGLRKPVYYFSSFCTVNSGDCEKIGISTIEVNNTRKKSKTLFDNVDFDVNSKDLYFYLNRLNDLTLRDERVPNFAKMIGNKRSSCLDKVFVKQKYYL